MVHYHLKRSLKEQETTFFDKSGQDKVANNAATDAAFNNLALMLNHFI
jgi:hypothetical protein